MRTIEYCARYSNVIKDGNVHIVTCINDNNNQNNNFAIIDFYIFRLSCVFMVPLTWVQN